jgi:hypothetical protein
VASNRTFSSSSSILVSRLRFGTRHRYVEHEKISKVSSPVLKFRTHHIWPQRAPTSTSSFSLVCRLDQFECATFGLLRLVRVYPYIQQNDTLTQCDKCVKFGCLLTASVCLLVCMCLKIKGNASYFFVCLGLSVCFLVFFSISLSLSLSLSLVIECRRKCD